jgi:transcriptional regulator with XRE-family HTH domain
MHTKQNRSQYRLRHFGPNLKRFRKRRDSRGRWMRQQKLGDMLGISKYAVQRWETGKCLPSLERLFRIAAFFGVSLDALFAAPSRRDSLQGERTKRGKGPRYRPERFGPNLKRLRKDRERGVWIRQQELAAILNVHPRTIRKWEKGERMPETGMLVRMAQALGVSLDALFVQ